MISQSEYLNLTNAVFVKQEEVEDSKFEEPIFTIGTLKCENDELDLVDIKEELSLDEVEAESDYQRVNFCHTQFPGNTTSSTAANPSRAGKLDKNSLELSSTDLNELGAKRQDNLYSAIKAPAPKQYYYCRICFEFSTTGLKELAAHHVYCTGEQRGNDKSKNEESQHSQKANKSNSLQPKKVWLSCDYCKLVTTKQSLTRHMKRAHKNILQKEVPAEKKQRKSIYTPLKCKLCNYEISTGESLEAHVKQFHVHNCPYCPFKAFKTDIVISHINNSEKQLYKCLQCGFLVCNKNDMEVHQNNHLN